jgi:hypothetical protein
VASIAEVSVGATKGALWAATDLGRQAGNAGIDFIQRATPGVLSPELVAQQAILKRFERRFAMVDLLDEHVSDDDMEIQALLAADALAEQGMVDEDTFVQARPILPGESVGDPVMDKKRKRAMHIFQLALEEEYNIMAADSYPIIPSERARSRLGRNAAWQAIAPELDGLALQFLEDGNYEPAFVGITGRAYERTMFGGHAAVILGSPRGSNLLALDSVGDRPQDNVLAWLRPNTTV